MDVYMRYIIPLSGKLKKYIDSRRPDIPEDVREKTAKFLATVFYLCEEWGAGDALAGMIINRNIGAREFETLKTILEGLGIKNLPPSTGLSGTRACIYVWDVLRNADFGDPEINEIMRTLEALGRSGGSSSIVKKLKELLGIRGDS